MSPTFYLSAMDRLTEECAPSVETDVVTVPVAHDLTGFADHVFYYSRTAPEIVAGSQGAAEIRVLDDQEQVLFATQFDGVDTHSDDDSTSQISATLAVRVPYTSTLASIQLYKNGVLQDSRVRTSHSPVITITQPTVGAILTDTLTINWDVTDGDSDSIQSDVLYSSDGVYWHPLVLRTVSSTLTVDTEHLAASSNASIRVRSSDGLNTTSTDVADLELLPNRIPTVWVVSPIDLTSYPSGANVMLLGGASDLEDKQIVSSNAQWYSNLDGYLAQGFQVNTTSLSVGNHLIEFRVVDSDGGSASTHVSISITQ